MSTDSAEKELVKRITANPKYQELVAGRSCTQWVLSVVMLVIYFSFILVVAFAPKSLGTKISPDSIISVGIPFGVSVIVSAFILTGIYVYKANSKYDELVSQIKEDVK
ncbi:MAG: DUF485 domain-containing protein [Magnetococcales bacterium]|nr:DUF485 domain-containing protein [Magnetococcales bacterium]